MALWPRPHSQEVLHLGSHLLRYLPFSTTQQMQANLMVGFVFFCLTNYFHWFLLPCGGGQVELLGLAKLSTSSNLPTAFSLPFLIGGRDGATPVFPGVQIHPDKAVLQQSMWSLCGQNHPPPTTNGHLTGRRSRCWRVFW